VQAQEGAGVPGVRKLPGHGPLDVCGSGVKRRDDGIVNDVTLSCATSHQTTVFLFCKLETIGLQTSKVESSTLSSITLLAWASGRAQQGIRISDRIGL
jgi:hypothetical protein